LKFEVEWFTLSATTLTEQLNRSDRKIRPDKEPLNMSTSLYLTNKKRKPRRKIVAISRKDLDAEKVAGYEPGLMLDTQHLLISALLPPAVKEFLVRCEAEVTGLCGAHHARGEGLLSRWGTQAGSIYLGGQKVAVQKPRVRGPNGEQQLTTYETFQDPKLFNQQVFQDGLRRITQRDYEKGLPKIAASFGMSKSTVSKSWKKATEKELEKLRTRSLKELGIVAVFIDGKRFSKLGAIVALGVGTDGRKHVLGLYQSSTENSAACRELLDDLERRGLPASEILFIVDGGSGLNKALEEKYQVHDPKARRACRVRCHVHKWRNITDVLTPKQSEEANGLFWAIREARDLTQAMECSAALEQMLGKFNQSALKSFLEAKEDILALHRLGLSSELRKFFSTTNPIESLNSLLEEDMRRVKRWQDSAHFQRWLATACLQNEKRMKRIRGYRSLPALTVRLQSLCNHEKSVDTNTQAA
jgi:transposase-like protein